MSDLADFLAEKLESSSYRDLEAKTGVSKGALENIIKRQITRLPELETLQRIAAAYEKPLWEVVQMAGADLELPQTATERSQRLEMLVSQVPRLEQLVIRLQALRDTDPDFVDGMILGLEASLNQRLHLNSDRHSSPDE